MARFLCTWSILTIVIVAVSGVAVPKCYVRCNMYLDEPVCAQNGQIFKRFQNHCLLLTANCEENADWQITAFTNCMKVIGKRNTNRCNLNCSSERKPVCGFLDNTYEVFDNDCLLRQQKCKDRRYWVEHPMSHCEPTVERTKRSVECPAICPLNYDPICAFDGRSNRVFSNDCELAAANCNNQRWMRTKSADCGEAAMRGYAQVGDDLVCPENCDYTASYVCGFNGEKYRIFGNECTFQLTRCRTKQRWTLKPLAECEGKDEWYFPLV